jgi:hypothetical protein
VKRPRLRACSGKFRHLRSPQRQGRSAGIGRK